MSKYAVMPLPDYVDACDTIREKTGNTDTIKSGELTDKVGEVYHSGQLSVISSAEVLKGTASGEVIAVNDVNPVEHKLSVGVRSGNLFDMSAISNTSYLTNNGDNSITIKAGRYSCSTSKNLKDLCPTLKVGDVCILSAESQGAKIINLLNVSTWGFGASKTITQEMLDATVYLYGVSQSTEDIIIKNIKIEPGTEATPYTPYIPDLSSVEVSRYGKNLFDISLVKNTSYIINNGDGTLTIKGGSLSRSSGIRLKKLCPALRVGDRAVLSGNSNGSNRIGVGVMWDFGEVRVVTQQMLDSIVYFYATSTSTIDDEFTISNIQIELRETATPYAPYKEPQTAKANAEGVVKGLTSLSPNMTLMTDTEGVMIDLEYYRDIDLAFENLTTAIALSGGE